MWRKCEKYSFAKIDDEFLPMQAYLGEEITINQWETTGSQGEEKMC